MDALHHAIVWLFVTVNAARTMAYVPQIWSALKSHDGARGISTITWGYFALSHLTGSLYSLDIAHDSKLASVFLCNFVACSVLLGVVCWRRRAPSPNAALAAHLQLGAHTDRPGIRTSQARV
jgi:hypothetical protein